jgi:hypothetical protein
VFSSGERAKIIELMIIQKFLNEALDEKCLIYDKRYWLQNEKYTLFLM